MCDKTQPLDMLQNQLSGKVKQKPTHINTCPIVQFTDDTLNTSETEPLTKNPQDVDYAELINRKFSILAIKDFVPKSLEIDNYSF